MSTELEPYRVTGELVTAQDVRQDLRERTTDSWTSVVAEVAKLANHIAGTDFVPKGLRDNPPAVTGAIMFGREVGFPPMTALQTLHNIEGRVSISAEGQRALVLQAGHEIVTVESTSAKCVMKGRRKGSTEWSNTSWTLDDARKAGLTNKTNWQKYPRAMLVARASADLCRLAFPDVIRGLMALEELEDVVAITGVEPVAPEPPAKVQRKARKKADPPVKAETPDEPLPEDEAAPQTGAESSGPSAGEASAEESDSAPLLPGETPQAGGDEREAQAETPDTGGVAGSNPDSVKRSSPPQTGGSGTTTGKGTPPEPEPVDSQPEPPLLPDEDGAYDAEVIEESEPQITPKQRNLLLMKFNVLEITDREERLFTANILVGREIDTFNDLTMREAGHLIDTLAPCETPEQLQAVVTATAEHAERGGE